MSIDTPAHRLDLQDLVAAHYAGCDTGDLALATARMLPDVRFTLPPLGQVFTDREQTKAGLAQVITKLPPMFRHRPTGYRFSSPAADVLRAEFVTHIMSCVDGSVHALGDIRVDAVLHDGALAVRVWEVRPVYFRGLITAGRLAPIPRVLLALVPFLLPAEARELFRAVSAGR